MTRISTKRYRNCLPIWLAVPLLAVFLAVRGLVPAGFMPTALAGGAAYDFCHGDSRSAQLLTLVASAQSLHNHQTHQHNRVLQESQASQHHYHQHDPATAKIFADNHCNFSAAATLLPAVELQLFSTAVTNRVSRYFFTQYTPLRGGYIRPQSRAPPNFSLT